MRFAVPCASQRAYRTNCQPRTACRAHWRDGCMHVRLATRASPLAMEQSRQVAQVLVEASAAQALRLQVEMVQVETLGDVDKTPSLRAMGPGAFTQALDEALVSGAADIAVHSLKDAPPTCLQHLTLAGCLPREDARDAILLRAGAASLASLPAGSRVGTSSSRRKAQILARHPQLQVVPLRGSVDARLAALDRGDLDATVLAISGLKRLQRAHLASEVLETQDMLPAACQGAIGIICRTSDTSLERLIAGACHFPTLLEVTCERAFLSELMGNPPQMPRYAVACLASATTATAPVFKAASPDDQPAEGSHGLNREQQLLALRLDCMVLSDDGSKSHRCQALQDFNPSLAQCSDEDVEHELLRRAMDLGKRQGQLMAAMATDMLLS